MEEEKVNEQVIEQAEAPKLSLEDSLEVGIAAVDVDKVDSVTEETPTNVVESGSEQAATGQEQAKNDLPVLQPPAEWTKEEKEDFALLSKKSQEAALRIHNNRTAKLEEIKREKEEAKREKQELDWLKNIATQVNTAAKTRGEQGIDTDTLYKAVKFYNETNANPQQAFRAVLEAKGLKVPQELLEVQENKSASDPNISALQSEIKALKDRQAQEDVLRAQAVIAESWQHFERQKNAAGSPKYVDVLGNSEAALKLQSQIVSLVCGDSPLSKQIAEIVKARNPEATYLDAYDYVYRMYGGQVDESSTPKTQEPQQQHIQRSNRASASVPGRGGSGANGSAPKKFSRDGALEYAFQVVYGR